jgi:acyl carrier protein
MERSQILAEVQTIFRDILDQDELVLQPETTADQVEDWDSLNHLHLVNAVERHFKIRFTVKEIQSWKNIDDLLGSINGKLN